MGIRVGIDLGTTFSAVARIDPSTGKPMVIKNSFGSATTPSVLCFERDGNILFGEDANNMQSVGDTNAIIGIPFGVQSIKFAQLAIMPFGAEIVKA